MKIRTDFVTNSSSSSFILAFKDKSTVLKELANGFDPDYLQAFSRICEQIYCSESYSKEEAVESFVDEETCVIRHAIARHQQGFGKSWREAWNYVESEEGKKQVESEISKRRKEFEKSLVGKDFIVEVEVDDYYAPAYVVEDCECCKAIFDHH